MVALAAGQEHLPGCVTAVVLPCCAADYYQLLCTDYIVVAVHYDLFGLLMVPLWVWPTINASMPSIV